MSPTPAELAASIKREITTARSALDRAVSLSSQIIAAGTLVTPPPVLPLPVTTGLGLVDRLIHPRPTPIVPGPAGSSWIERTFGTNMGRVTDQTTNPDAGKPVNTLSTIGGTWNKDGTKFILMGSGGNVMFFGRDGAKFTLLPKITIRNQGEPHWSYVDPNVIYYNQYNPNVPDTYRLIKRYNIVTGVEDTLADMDAMYGNLGLGMAMANAYTGPLVFKDDDLWALLFGGTQQNTHYLIHHSQYGLIDYRTLTVQSSTGPLKGTTLHGFGMDRLGRLCLNPSDAGSASGIAQIQVYDPATKTLTPLTDNMQGGGHYQLGHNQMINMANPYQWLRRSLDNLGAVTNLITPPLTSPARGLDDHTDWRNGKPGQQLPILSVTIRKDLPLLSGGPWGPWDDEAIFVHTDGSGIVERLCHHQSVYDPNNYRSQPEGHIDPTGQWVVFASSWGNLLGTYIDHNDGDKVKQRQDVFIVQRRVT